MSRKDKDQDKDTTNKDTTNKDTTNKDTTNKDTTNKDSNREEFDEIDERYLASFAEERFNERLRHAPHIGAFLAQLIREQGLTAPEVARAAKLHPSTIYRFVQGVRVPERDTLIVLLEVFGLPVHQISRVLMFAGYAPLHHLRQAAQPWPTMR